jgi:hypothetical protein
MLGSFSLEAQAAVWGEDPDAIIATATSISDGQGTAERKQSEISRKRCTTASTRLTIAISCSPITSFRRCAERSASRPHRTT